MSDTSLNENGKPNSKFGRTYVAITLPGKTEQQLDQLEKDGEITPLIKNNILTMREIFNNYDVIEPLLISKLENMGVRSKLDIEEQERENKEGDDVSQVSRDIDSHADEFYTHSMTDDLSSSMIFFLSTRPALRYSTQDDVDKGIVKSLYKKTQTEKKLELLFHLLKIL